MMLLNVALLVLVIGHGNELKPPFPDPIEKEKLAGDSAGEGTSVTPTGSDTGSVATTQETYREKFVPGSRIKEPTSQSSQTPTPTTQGSDTFIRSSPKSRGRKQPVDANPSVNTPESSQSSSGDTSSTINYKREPPFRPAPASQTSTNPSGTGASDGGSVSVAVPNSCDNLSAGADQIPFSCYDQKKLKDYCTQTFGSGAPPVQVNSGNRHSGFKRYVVDTTTKANWFQAVGLCLSRNMSLATVESYDDQKAIAAALNSAGGVQNAWLSATDLGQLNHYVWMSTGQPVSWTNWYDGEPNHERSGNETEHCIEVINYRWKWNDNLCDNQEYFVCQYYSNN